MNRSYKIFKLNSGEEIICSVINKNKGAFTIVSPMVFKTITAIDPMGYDKEITFLKDWLVYAKDKSTKIKETQVTSIIDPSDKVINMYKAQQHTETKVKEFNADNDPNKKSGDFPDNINDLMKDIMDMSKPKNPESGTFKFEMELTKKDFEDFIEKGLISDDFLDELISDMVGEGMDQEVPSEEYTGDETDHPNFGNRWTDWDNNPFDYLR